MLTEVILNGPLGKQFGRKWEVAAHSPAQALKIINANKPGVFTWIRNNLRSYEKYRVRVEYSDGRKEEMDNDTFLLNRHMKRVTFTPIVEGARTPGVKFVVGALMVAAAFTWGYASGGTMAPWAQSLAMNGFIMMGAAAVEYFAKPDTPDDDARKDRTSYQYDGAVNTTTQGVPVPLIYGRSITGAHAISASISIDQLL